MYKRNKDLTFTNTETGACQILSNVYKWKFSRRYWDKWITIKLGKNIKVKEKKMLDVYLLGKYNTPNKNLRTKEFWEERKKMSRNLKREINAANAAPATSFIFSLLSLLWEFLFFSLIRTLITGCKVQTNSG